MYRTPDTLPKENAGAGLATDVGVRYVVIGTSGTAGMIRRLRANLLDELRKQYVVTGRAKGLPPGRLTYWRGTFALARP